VVFLEGAAVLRVVRPSRGSRATATGLGGPTGDPGRSILRPPSVPQGGLEPRPRSAPSTRRCAEPLLRQQGQGEQSEQGDKMPIIHRPPTLSFIDPPSYPPPRRGGGTPLRERLRVLPYLFKTSSRNSVAALEFMTARWLTAALRESRVLLVARDLDQGLALP